MNPERRATGRWRLGRGIFGRQRKTGKQPLAGGLVVTLPVVADAGLMKDVGTLFHGESGKASPIKQAPINSASFVALSTIVLDHGQLFGQLRIDCRVGMGLRKLEQRGPETTDFLPVTIRLDIDI